MNSPTHPNRTRIASRAAVVAGLAVLVGATLVGPAAAADAGPGPAGPAATTVVLSEDFPGTTLPVGWTMQNRSDGQLGWFFNDPAHRGNQTGGSGGFAIIDSDYVRTGVLHANLETPQLTKLAGTVATVSFSTIDVVANKDTSGLEVKTPTSGGWSTVWSITNHAVPASTRISVQLPRSVTSAKHFTLRWTNKSFLSGYWEVDDILVTTR